MSSILKIRDKKTKEFLNTKTGTFSKNAGTTFKLLYKAKENLELFKKYDFRFLDKRVVELELVEFEMVEKRIIA